MARALWAYLRPCGASCGADAPERGFISDDTRFYPLSTRPWHDYVNCGRSSFMRYSRVVPAPLPGVTHRVECATQASLPHVHRHAVATHTRPPSLHSTRTTETRTRVNTLTDGRTVRRVDTLALHAPSTPCVRFVCARVSSYVLAVDEHEARNKHGRDHHGDALAQQHAVGHGNALLQGKAAHHEAAERANARSIRAKVGAENDC